MFELCIIFFKFFSSSPLLGKNRRCRAIVLLFVSTSLQSVDPLRKLVFPIIWVYEGCNL